MHCVVLHWIGSDRIDVSSYRRHLFEGAVVARRNQKLCAGEVVPEWGLLDVRKALTLRQ